VATFVPAFKPPADISNACYVVLSDSGLLCGEASSWQPLDSARWRFAGIVPREQHFVGYYNNQPTFAINASVDARLPFGLHWLEPRVLLAQAAIDEPAFCAVSCAMQVFNWDRDHQFCGRCSAATVPHLSERARICEACEINYYPRLSPCVIVLITRGEECLLAMHRHSRSRFYSALAGFIEPGESVEGALRREVMEEVGLEVSDLHYQGSQPWPFPGQLMLGFYAQYRSGDIRIDDAEIETAAWFHHRDLPTVPPASTLSGSLIRGFVERFGAQP
jgi:NAD+ diphosphatase